MLYLCTSLASIYDCLQPTEIKHVGISIYHFTKCVREMIEWKCHMRIISLSEKGGASYFFKLFCRVQVVALDQEN